MDPLFVKWASLVFAGLLLLAARHKLASVAAFRAVLDEYRLLPGALIGAAAWTIPSVELALAAAWLGIFAGIGSGAVAGFATAALLATYTSAIAVNLLRGRRYISCGCSLSVSGGEYLSWGLVWRNAFLVGLALAAALPAPDRALGAGGYAVLAAALLASMLLYMAGSQLLRNFAVIGAWRRGDD